MVQVQIQIGRSPVFLVDVSNPNTLGLMLQNTDRDVEVQIVQGLELAWVQQVIENIRQGYRYNVREAAE